jgi:hypothetical protein
MIHAGDKVEVRPALGRAIRERLERDLDHALKRRPADETVLSGVVRALSPYNLKIRSAARQSLEVLAKRRSFDRPLYHVLLRTMGDLAEPSACSLVEGALGQIAQAGYTPLAAACGCANPAVLQELSRAAGRERAHTAFAAELALACHASARPAHLIHLAPMIKEEHRISLCYEFVPALARLKEIPSAVGPALRVLRAAERHLGRWLGLAEIEVRSGEFSSLGEAKERLDSASASGRGSWQLMVWALEYAKNPARGPSLSRVSVDALSRLAERADRASHFGFRLAAAREVAMEQVLGHQLLHPPRTADSIRAAMHLGRDLGHAQMRDTLADACDDRALDDDLRGLAVASLYDVGDRDGALERALELQEARSLKSAAWAALVRYRMRERAFNGCSSPVVTESRYRWIQCGWLE